MKKFSVYWAPLAASSLAIFSTPAFSDLSGPYVGGGIGLFGSYTAEVTQESFQFGLDDEELSEFVGYTDWFTNADLLVGYGEQVDNFYLGGEFTLSAGLTDEDVEEVSGTDTVTNDRVTQTYNIEAGQGYALSGRAGYVLAPSSMVYAKLSYQVREFEAEASIDEPGFSETASDDDNFSGFGIGVGFEHQLQDLPLAFRIEAMRVDYGDEDLTLEDDDWGIEQELNVEPVENTVDLQAVYRF